MATQTQRPVSEVLQNIVANIQQIIRAEFRLAKAEMAEKAAAVARPASLLTLGVVLGLYGLGFLLLASVYAFSIVLAPWLAALIVGATLAILGAILFTSGRKDLRGMQLVPKKTAETLKENVEWAKAQIK